MESDGAPVWVVGARSETGYARGENQDRMSRVSAGFGDVFIVSDGMGGHKGGAVAAEMTVATIEKHLVAADAQGDVGESVRKAVEAANEAVYSEAHRGDVHTEGMGATALVVVTRDASALVAHVGDSRAYLFRDGRLQRLTVDHTRVQRMIEANMLSPAEAETHPDASLLERAIGHKPDIDVEVAPWLRLQGGDHLLLCSDGLSGYVEDQEIETVMANDAAPQALVDGLVELSLAKGGNDNVTVQVIRYGDPMANVTSTRMLLYQAAFLPLSALVAGVVAYVVSGYGAASPPAAPGPNLQQLAAQVKELGDRVALIEKNASSSAAQRPEPVLSPSVSDGAHVPTIASPREAPVAKGTVAKATPHDASAVRKAAAPVRQQAAAKPDKPAVKPVAEPVRTEAPAENAVPNEPGAPPNVDAVSRQ